MKPEAALRGAPVARPWGEFFRKLNPAIAAAVYFDETM
jgi:hypothetical protein